MPSNGDGKLLEGDYNSLANQVGFPTPALHLAFPVKGMGLQIRPFLQGEARYGQQKDARVGCALPFFKVSALARCHCRDHIRRVLPPEAPRPETQESAAAVGSS